MESNPTVQPCNGKLYYAVTYRCWVDYKSTCNQARHSDDQQPDDILKAAGYLARPNAMTKNQLTEIPCQSTSWSKA
jgi:hypothetical protein